MILPTLLPNDLRHHSTCTDDNDLFLQIKSGPLIEAIDFFYWACDDETWAEEHEEFMRKMIHWITEEFLYDRLARPLAERAASGIRMHDLALSSFVEKNMEVEVEGKRIAVNSMLFATSSNYFYELVKGESSKENIIIFFDELDYIDFEEVIKYVNTGKVRGLWRDEKEEIFKILVQAQLWGLYGLADQCQEVLKRYIDQKSCISILRDAHQKGWVILKHECYTFINNLNRGVKLHEMGDYDLAFEFLNYLYFPLEVFDQLKDLMTHLIIGSNLTLELSFSEVVVQIPHLISLDISGTTQFSERVADVPSNLEEVKLNMCPWLTDDHLARIIAFFSNLKRVSLRSNIHLDQRSWNILNKLHNLEGIDVGRCHQIDDDDFGVLFQSCHQVKEWNLEECHEISDRAFSDFARSTPELTHLNITRCPLSDFALIEIASYCKELLVLKMGHCQSISDSGVIEAIIQAPVLDEIHISGCNFSQATINTIHQLKPYLKVID